MEMPRLAPGSAPDRGLYLMKNGLILFGLFLVMFFFTVLAQTAVSAVVAPGTRTKLIICSTIQSVMLFGIPALLWSAISTGTQFAATLDLDRRFSFRALSGALAVFVISIPALNSVIEFNASMTLPWPEIEKTFKAWEKAAEAQTNILLDTDTVGGLLTGILCVGVITGICEELFFRGALQGMLTNGGLNHHAAIWTAAAIFSLAHFQFFGFIPRILLGAFFGYLFYWTRSLWLNATLHAFNNTLVVYSAWSKNRGTDLDDTAAAGILEGSAHWPLVIASAVATILILHFFRKWLFFPLVKKKAVLTFSDDTE